MVRIWWIIWRSRYVNDDMKDILAKHIISPVRFSKSLENMIKLGVDTFIEIGPGNAVSGFLRKTAKAMGVEVSVASIDSVEDFKKLIG